MYVYLIWVSGTDALNAQQETPKPKCTHRLLEKIGLLLKIWITPIILASTETHPAVLSAWCLVCVILYVSMTVSSYMYHWSRHIICLIEFIILYESLAASSCINGSVIVFVSLIASCMYHWLSHLVYINGSIMLYVSYTASSYMYCLIGCVTL